MQQVSTQSASEGLAAASEVEAVLARFPGPVTLYVGRGKKLLALALCVAFAAFMIWLAMNPRERVFRSPGYDIVMTWISLLVFGGLSVRAVLMLAWPHSASLRLDADAMEVGRVFGAVRSAWANVDGFRSDDTESFTVVYNVTDARSRTPATRYLPDNYGFAKRDLARLLNAWRQQALASSANHERA